MHTIILVRTSNVFSKSGSTQCSLHQCPLLLEIHTALDIHSNHTNNCLYHYTSSVQNAITSVFQGITCQWFNPVLQQATGVRKIEAYNFTEIKKSNGSEIITDYQTTFDTEWTTLSSNQTFPHIISDDLEKRFIADLSNSASRKKYMSHCYKISA